MNERKPPRRLFSFDSIKSSPTRHSSSETDITPTGGPSHIDTSESNGNWALPNISESPHPTTTTLFSEREKRKGPRPPLPPVLVDATARAVTPDSPAPSSIRWNSLRQHVLPSSHSQQSSSASLTAISTQAASRTGHAKQSSKFAQKLGFRNVVNQVKQVMVDEMHQFSLDIERACLAARHVELASNVKSRNDPISNTVGSTLSLPFMSGSTITVGSGGGLASQSRSDLRQSSYGSSIVTSGRVRPLYQTLINYAGPFADGSPPLPQVPMESLVLSTLLIPFLTTERPSVTEDDRWLCIEAFQIIIKTWNPTTEIVAVERVLWCVEAALSSLPPMRTRILSVIWAITVSEETHYPASDPRVLQTLLHGLFLLLPSVSAQVSQETDTEESKLLSEIIAEVCAGSCGGLDDLHVEEEYNALFVDGDSAQRIRDAVAIEALGKCLEYSSDFTRRWLLRNSVENLWSSPDDVSFTPLLTAIHSRALQSFTRASLSLLSATSYDAKLLRSDASLIVRALQSRVFPELRSITSPTIEDVKQNVVLIALNLISLDAKDLLDWSISTIVEWYRQMPDWKVCFEKSLTSLITVNPWVNILKILPPLVRLLPEDIRRPLTPIILSTLNTRLVDDPPPYPCFPLSSLLDTFSQTYPQIFYKPLFLCAASSKEHAVVNHLCTLTALARFMPDLWIKDAEMMSIAIMSDGGPKSKKPASEATKHLSRSVKPWGIARLGQSVLLVELIAQVQGIRRARENQNSLASDNASTAMAKFAIALEQRLSILIETKEQTAWIPLSQRLLFCMLFREIRLLTRSLKNASWLSRFVDWFIAYQKAHFDDDSDLVTSQAIQQIQDLYALTQTGGRSSSNHRSTAVFSLTPTRNTFTEGAEDKGIGMAAIFSQRTPILDAMARGFEARALKLLVAMSGLIRPEESKRIGNVLWKKHLEDNDPKILSAICFLVMQCAEKNPDDLLASIEVDLRSSSDDTRLAAIRKMSILTNWRFQIMSQHVIADRAHRPFKVARGPLPFVTTDMGSSTFVLELDPNDTQDKLPMELRKKLAEIGWDDDDSPVNQQLEWTRTPMSNLPVMQVEKIDFNAPPSPSISPMSSPTKSPLPSDKAEELNLLRRNSTSGGPLSGMKRRAIFVPTLSHALPRITSLTFDPSFVVANAARGLVIDLMRNDPGLLTRPVWDLFSGEGHDLSIATTSLRAFLHSRLVLPPAMAHLMLNTLAGFLKFLSKQAESENALYYFAQLVPTIAKVIPQVSEMSIRELRRAKVDIFLVPSGSLWFPSSAPPGPMFPRRPGSFDNPFEDAIESRIAPIIMIRISQNMLFLAMLKRNPAEVQIVRKNMAKLVFPSLTGKADVALELKDFIPTRDMSPTPLDETSDRKLRGLSLILSRSYLLLVAQIFRCLSRHLNDRNELSTLLESLNRIILAHGDDVGVVAQALIALMVASTRFRRLFASGGSYTLFMPALFKVYAESEAHRGIRSAIEFAVNRFYAYHEETFVFQSLDAIAHVLALPDIDQAWIIQNVYSLFASLRRNNASSDADMAGIHHANKNEEREALIVITAEEKPQTFFASLRNSGNQNAKALTVELPIEYESKRLEMDDFIRLFLTVIAHDLSIARAQQFLKLLRYLVPSLYEASTSARSVLQEGLNALGSILSRPIPKGKPVELSDTQPERNAFNGMQLADLSKLPSDISSMRIDYLWSLVSFAEVGGRLSADAVRNAFDLAKALLRETPSATTHSSVASFLGAFSKRFMAPKGGRSLKAIIHFLRDLAPIINEHARTIDFTEVFDTIGQLSKNDMYFNDPTFCQLVVAQICGAGLRACNVAALDGLLLSLPSRLSLVSLIVNTVRLPAADIFGELAEVRRPNHNFLALVVLPLALRMKTLAELDLEGAQLDIAQRNLQAQAWSRLLLYVISCCRRTHGPGGDTSPVPERSRSQDKRTSTTGYGSHLPSLLVALQIIKIIIVRAGDDLSWSLPDIWSRLAVFLKEVLEDGNAEFSLRSQEQSPFPSPTPSPRTSGQFNMASTSSTRRFMSPRILDYCLWSFLELLCVYRNPLFIQLRAFVHEKVRVLDQELRYHRDSHTPFTSRSRRPSSVFTKPRRRMSNVSGTSSPDASPRLTALAIPDIYQNIPPPPPLSYPSSQESSSHGPRIVHLGLVSNSNTFRRSLSPAGTKMARSMAKSTHVKSLILIRKTYFRIRVVQSCMGYQGELLPLPQTSVDTASEVDDLDSPTTAWTKRRALQEVTSETRELLAEFDESLNDLDSVEGIVDEWNLVK